jgi:single-strand DNA-binding protein
MKKIIITGHLGRDPEGRHSPNGEWFVTFTVAVNVGTKTNPRTDWVDVACNGKLAEIAQTYLKKGTKVLIEGFPSATAYINKEGKPVANIRVTARTMEILSSKESSGTDATIANESESHMSHEEDFSHISSDDIPF